MEQLNRTLGTGHAVVVGLGAMLGAGVFVALAPAAAAAGRALPVALVLAGAVAWANADSTARLAAVHPTSGGAYTYGRARLGTAAGVTAGVAFLVGKTLSTAAIAWTVGTSLHPGAARALAVGAVVALTALACAGVHRGARVTAVVVAVVLGTLAVVVVLAVGHVSGGLPVVPPLPPPGGADDVLRAAGLCFFAFAGYARVATLGEEVRDPARTLPRAIAVALGVVLLTYGAVAWALQAVLGAGLALTDRPVVAAAEVLGGATAGVVVAVVAALAALASGLGVLLGLSRTGLAMARDGVLPRALARLDGPVASRRPVRAQLVVGVAVVGVLLVVDLERAVAWSSTAVLVYYAVAHAAAFTLPGRVRRVVPALGLVGCAVVAVALVV